MLALSLVTLLFAAPLAPAVGDAPLADAAMQGDRATVQSLLAGNADVNAAQGDGTTALHWAAYRDDLEMARMLVEAGADLNARTRVGELTALFLAARNGNAAMLYLLLEAGDDANAAGTTGTTPLMLAAASGQADAVKVLLDKGAAVNANDIANGQTALMFAAARNRAEVIDVLAAQGADLNATSRVNQIRSSENPNRNREDEGRNPTIMGGLTALHFAAREGHMEAVEALVEAGADVNQVSASDRGSAMTQAIINASFDIGKFLLDHGADPNLVSTRGLNPLYATMDAQWATLTSYPPPSAAGQKTSYLELLQALLDKGADPDVQMGPMLWFRQFTAGDWVDAGGATPFWRAAQANDLPAMRILVAAGAEPNIPTEGGVSPLQVTAGYGFEHDASTVVPDARFESVRYLVDELGAAVRSTDSEGYTPLHGAAVVGENEIIRFLVASGADPTARAHLIRVGDDGQREIVEGAGDTVVDMANGPFQRAIIYPDTIELLEGLGSVNSHNCRSAACLNPNRPGG